MLVWWDEGMGTHNACYSVNQHSRNFPCATMLHCAKVNLVLPSINSFVSEKGFLKLVLANFHYHFVEEYIH